MKTKYHTIRKTSYDTLWHAVYTVDGKDTWDRIPEGEALRLARELPPQLPPRTVNPLNAVARVHEAETGIRPQREDAPAIGNPPSFSFGDIIGCADHLNVK
jgi:hypothetical protein